MVYKNIHEVMATQKNLVTLLGQNLVLRYSPCQRVRRFGLKCLVTCRPPPRWMGRRGG